MLRTGLVKTGAKMLWALTLLCGALGVWLALLNVSTVAPPTWGFAGGPRTVWSNLPRFIVGFVIASTGLVIALNKPRNAIGSLLSLSGFLMALDFLAAEYVVYAFLTRPGALPGGTLAGLVHSTIWIWYLQPTIFLSVLLFPNGRLPSRRWRWLLWYGLVSVILLNLIVTFLPGPLSNAQFVDNPLGIPALGPWIGPLQLVAYSSFLTSSGATVAGLVTRYRTSDHTTRQQIKWLALAGSLTTLALVMAVLGGRTQEYIAIISMVFIPIGFAVAILRHHLYDIDFIINRTLVYGLLTAMLGVLYFGVVAALQTLFVRLAGQESPLAVVVTTLLIAALFNPLRRRLQDFIDRRFYRKKYDARQPAPGESSRSSAAIP